MYKNKTKQKTKPKKLLKNQISFLLFIKKVKPSTLFQVNENTIFYYFNYNWVQMIVYSRYLKMIWSKVFFKQVVYTFLHWYIDQTKYLDQSLFCRFYGINLRLFMIYCPTFLWKPDYTISIKCGLTRLYVWYRGIAFGQLFRLYVKNVITKQFRCIYHLSTIQNISTQGWHSRFDKQFNGVFQFKWY